jgi:hypothetical protein
MAITAGRNRNLRAFQMFMGGIKSPATKKVYEYAFKDFMQFAKAKTPEDILRKKPKVLQDIIIDYVLDMKEKRKFSYSTRSAFMKIQSRNIVPLQRPNVPRP